MCPGQALRRCALRSHYGRAMAEQVSQPRRGRTCHAGSQFIPEPINAPPGAGDAAAPRGVWTRGATVVPARGQPRPPFVCFAGIPLVVLCISRRSSCTLRPTVPSRIQSLLAAGRQGWL